MLTRILGSTKERVTIIGIGGYHIGKGDPSLGIRIIRAAIDEGINFMDNAWCYNQGASERIMGEALKGGYRDQVFLMTKNHGRDAQTFRKQLEESLRRLRTDHIDLLQFHEIVHPGLPQQIFSQGAIEEALKAREEGKIRFIGFTGHRWPYLFQEMLAQDFTWDAVQLPVNLLDAHYRSFAKGILPLLKERGIGAIGMKSLAGGELLKTGIPVDKAIAYSLSQPIDTLVTGIDSMEVLEQNLAIARAWEPMPIEEQTTLLAQVAPFAQDGHLERYKTG
ncbi:MAG: aldo/keto reductase [Anaerolineae bacterium]|nr:aldo/keto reductase [Anaerolineae bacterium]